MNSKRILSVLLCIIMILTAIPTTVFASIGDAVQNVEAKEASKQEITEKEDGKKEEVTDELDTANEPAQKEAVLENAADAMSEPSNSAVSNDTQTSYPESLHPYSNNYEQNLDIRIG